MANAHSTVKEAATQAPTTYEMARNVIALTAIPPNGGYTNPRPQLTIKGHWLEQLGF